MIYERIILGRELYENKHAMATYKEMAFIVTMFVILGVCTRAEAVKAKCVVDKTSGTSGSAPIEGTIEMTEPESGETIIKISLKGFGNSAVEKHGFHIHAVGDLGNGCTNAGGHYNPNNRLHGAPSDAEDKRHVGDLGNIVVPATGEIMTTITDPLVKLSGDTNVIGLAFVIHADEDDLGKGTFPDSNSTGHAGARVGCCKIEQAAEDIKAKCVVDKTSGKEGSAPIEGTIEMTEPESGDITIKIALTGFGNSAVEKHGFHIHAVGDLGNGCTNAGGHYNPNNRLHGAPSDAEDKRHIGDLGNIAVPATGEITTTITDPLIKLSGDTSVIGLAFVIHADEDDLGKGTFPDSNSTGHAGARVGCCKIERDSSDISSASHVTVGVITVISTLVWSLVAR